MLIAKKKWNPLRQMVKGKGYTKCSKLIKMKDNDFGI